MRLFILRSLHLKTSLTCANFQTSLRFNCVPLRPVRTHAMSSKLLPGDPEKVMVIRDLPNSNITTLSLPFMRFGRIKIGGRATLVKLQTGNVAVFSPVSLTSDVKSKVKTMGPIKYIIAPDVEHHLMVETWAKEYPEAELIGPEGLPEKHPGLKFAHVFSSKAKNDMHISTEFDKEFASEYFPMHPNKELVFCTSLPLQVRMGLY